MFSRVVRKAIARVHIVMHTKQKENLKKFFKVLVRSFTLDYPVETLLVFFC